LAIDAYITAKYPELCHTFRSTGQTGFLISNSGINLDTTPADFMAGEVEKLSPNNSSSHWDIIEGQGSILHPAYAGGSVALIMGSQPDMMVMCVDVKREKYRNTNVALAPLYQDMSLCLEFARRSNAKSHFVAVSLNVEPCQWLSSKDTFERAIPGVHVINPNLEDTLAPLVECMIRYEKDSQC
jgi:uncharacterized NAD-dependent epimerase/dehydratase family protein